MIPPSMSIVLTSKPFHTYPSYASLIRFCPMCSNANISDRPSPSVMIFISAIPLLNDTHVAYCMSCVYVIVVYFVSYWLMPRCISFPAVGCRSLRVSDTRTGNAKE